MRTPLLLISTLACLTGPAAAGPTAEGGARIAAAKCSRCHATESKGDSPQSVAPPFRDLYADYPIAMLVDAQKSGLISGHDEMPAFDFTEEEVTALLLHIDSLAPGKPAYVKR